MNRMSILGLTGFCVLMSGCGTYLHSGSMRVDVEVYKGPLSKHRDVQLAELAGVVDESCRILDSIIDEGLRMRGACGRGKAECPSNELEAATCQAEYCGVLKAAKEKREFLKSAFLTGNSCPHAAPACTSHESPVCPAVSEALRNALTFRCADGAQPRREGCAETIEESRGKKSAEISDPAKRALRANLEKIVTFGAKLRLDSFSSAYYMNSTRPESRAFREFNVRYVNFAGEVGNHLTARADALLKQLDGVESRKLAQGVFLRDAEPTSLLNMFAWDWAMKDRLREDSVPFNDREEIANRVRALEHHFADYYWANINTVVAIGQGEVGMALVKDDIGNWHLKNFESDPSEVIQAYKNLGMAALKEAATQISTAGLGAAQRLVAFSNRMSLGEGGEAAGGNLDGVAKAVHRQTAARLATAAKEIPARKISLTKVRDDARAKAEKPEGANCTTGGEEVMQSKGLQIAHAILARTQPTADKKAEGAAQAAIAKAAAANPATCASADGVRADAWKADQLAKADDADRELNELPEKARGEIAQILDDHQKTIADLMKAGKAVSAEKKDSMPVQ